MCLYMDVQNRVCGLGWRQKRGRRLDRELSWYIWMDMIIGSVRDSQMNFRKVSEITHILLNMRIYWCLVPMPYTDILTWPPRTLPPAQLSAVAPYAAQWSWRSQLASPQQLLLQLQLPYDKSPQLPAEYSGSYSLDLLVVAGYYQPCCAAPNSCATLSFLLCYEVCGNPTLQL